MDLEDWVVQYVKNRNLMKRTLKSHESMGDRLRFTFEDMEHDYLVKHDLDDAVLKEPEDRMTSVACVHHEDNLNFLIKHWDTLKSKKLSFLFINPQTQEKWVIRPHIHAKVADPETLEEGLRAMFAENVS